MSTMSKRTNTSLNTVARSNLRASKGKYVLTGIGIAVASFFIAAIIVLLGSLQGTIDAAIGDALSEDDNVVLSLELTTQIITRRTITSRPKILTRSPTTLRFSEPGSYMTGR